MRTFVRISAVLAAALCATIVVCAAWLAARSHAKPPKPEYTAGPFVAKAGRDLHSVGNVPSAKWETREAHLNVRELPRLIDPSTSTTLGSASNLEITGRTDDGEPDRLRLILEVEGLHESEGTRVMHVTIDRVTVAIGPLSGFAAPAGPYRWKGAPELELGFDAKQGQAVEIQIGVSLPEGGVSVFRASPRLTGPHFHPRRGWQGQLYSAQRPRTPSVIRDRG